MRRLFHLVPRDAWRAHCAEAATHWAPPSLASEGFVHLSHAEQLAGTLEVHFAAVASVVLLEVDGRELAGDLVHEPSRGGELFPHLYRALARGELVRSWALARRSGGFALPRLGDRPADDRPPGHPIA